jgi:hypothetical protein
MGHQRLGELPAHRLLPEIVRYLVEGGTPTADLVDQVTQVGQDALKRGLKDPVFVEALWFLIWIPQAAGTADHPNWFQDLYAPLGTSLSFSELLVAYDAALERVQRCSHASATDLGEMARQAGLAAFAEAVRDGLPGLWAPTAEDVRASISVLRRPDQFAAMAHRFYANFVERVIHYYIDRNLHRMVGPGRVARSVHDLRSFDEAIRRHCDEAALIMRAFARDWLGKNHFKDGVQISREDVRRFSACAGEKIRRELAKRKGGS